MAEAIRSKEELTVADMQEFTGRLVGVDTVMKSCKIDIDGKTFRGKITDPSLLGPQNIYTHSMHIQKPIIIIAKPVLKGGAIRHLYISDAKYVE